jgi:hypothetical protein
MQVIGLLVALGFVAALLIRFGGDLGLPRLASRLPPRPAGRGSGDAETLEVVTQAVQARGIPPVRQDPALGPPPEPADLASPAIPVPAPYAALAQWIADFEPGDDLELRMFMDSNAAGQLALADAWHAQADILLNGVGLDPAYIAGILEVGNSAGEHASLIAQVHKRLMVIYGQIKEAIANGLLLPHKAREFLTGE